MSLPSLSPTSGMFLSSLSPSASAQLALSAPRTHSQSGEVSPIIPEIAVFGSTESLGQHDVESDPDTHPPSPALTSPSLSPRERSPASARDYSPAGPDFLSLPSPGGVSGGKQDTTSFDPSESQQFDGVSYQPPPSPALSAHSANSYLAPTTLQLRQNRPHESDGISSLNLLTAPSHAHRRRGSSATIASSVTGSETVADHHSDIGMSPRSDAGSTLGSPTHTHVDDDDDYPHSRSPSRSPSRSSFAKFHRLKRSTTSPSISSDMHSSDETDGGRKKGRKGKKPAELARPERVELPQESDFDPAPFAFKPLQLANLVDPKSIEALEDMGGIEGLLRGVGSHRTGLGIVPDDVGSDDDSVRSSIHRLKSGVEDMPRPDITLTVPEGEDTALPTLPSHSTPSVAGGAGAWDPSAAFAASIEERQRVFGENVLPVRHAKSLWRLMWGALTDKVLVRRACRVASSTTLLHSHDGKEKKIIY